MFKSGIRGAITHVECKTSVDRELGLINDTEMKQREEMKKENSKNS